MPHNGRIPVLFVLAEGTPAWVGGIVSRLSESGLRVGLTSKEGLQIGEDWIRGPRGSLWDDVRALQIDPSVGAIVMVSDGDALLQTGLPVHYIDGLVVQAHRPAALNVMSRYLRGLRAVVGERLRLRYGALMQQMEKPWVTWESEEQLPINDLLEVMLAAETLSSESCCPERNAGQF
jgi:hypothetical protein